MRSFLLSSTALHAAGLAGVALLAPSAPMRPPRDVYRIDFIGGARATAPAEAAPAAPAKPAVEKPAKRPVEAPDPDAIVKPGRTKKPLTPPSMLRPSMADAPPAETASAAPERDGSPGAGGSSVLADFPDFPYPWYITQVRTALAQQWTRHMPRGGRLECVVRVVIGRDGRTQEVSVETPSGNSLFDYAAVSSVRGAAPFPPLPNDYTDDALNAHIQFRTLP